MIDERLLNTAIESALENLDITPAMFKEAEGHYKAIASFLSEKGVAAEISTFGSIATGTVTRPYSPDEESYFDFDVLCVRSDLDKNACKPSEVRQPIEKAIRSSDRYSPMAKTCNECITIEYVLNGKTGGFRLDINPCVNNIGNEPEITECSTWPLFSDNTVSIAQANSEEWLGSNPNGFVSWFKTENGRFAKAIRDTQRAKIFASSRNLFASIEEVPVELERTQLQRAIQFIKRSRDVHYHNASSQNKKPTSCVLMVLTCHAAESLPDEASAMEIVRAFTSMISTLEFKASLHEQSIIGTPGKWRLDNPVYEGNLIEQEWTDQDTEAMFAWNRALKNDLADLKRGGEFTYAATRSLLGKGSVSAAATKFIMEEQTLRSPNTISSTNKPWSRSL